MKSDAATTLVGHTLRTVEQRDHSWFFIFGDEMSIVTESPWRFITPECIFVTSEDHGHPFGLPAPVDAAARVMSRLDSVRVSAASIHEITGDLHVYFGPEVYLEFLQMSGGYESWRLYIRGAETICMGGGELAHFEKPQNV